MSNDWYARRMASERGHAPPPAPPPAYPQRPQPAGQQPVGYLADGTPIYATPPQPQYQPPQPQYPQHPGQPQMSEAEMIHAARTGGTVVTPMDVLERAGMKGGKGTKTETMNCPECDSPHFFQRRGAGKMGMPPAPYCHTCGYNGMFEQYGTMEVPLTPEG